MRTSNAKVLDEIDCLEELKGVDAKDLAVVKMIEKLQNKLSIFWVVSNKTTNLFFREREAAELFMSKQTATTGFNLVATTFADS